VQLLNGERLSSETLGRLDRTIICDQTVEVELPDGRTEEFNSDLIIDAKLRQFYTFFCLKEAYIKLVGEGLMAPWIKECEFRNVHPPIAGTVARCSTMGSWGGKTTGGRAAIQSVKAKQSKVPIIPEEEEIEIWLHGEEVHDVITEVQAFEENFMIATMIRPATALGSKAEFPPWEKILNLERDILAVAVNSAMETAMEASFWESFYSAAKPEPPLVSAVSNIQLDVIPEAPLVVDLTNIQLDVMPEPPSVAELTNILLETVEAVEPNLPVETSLAEPSLSAEASIEESELPELPLEPRYEQELYGNSPKDVTTIKVVEGLQISNPDYAVPAGPVDICA
jgi:hypothetical protein